MQVMDNREFEQDHVLIGRKGEIGKATVTNDPILMSMLSTGLYANPLKSMVQEITFNAWDAHRMGKCLDKPIDIYFNDTTGMIIRDYGPGIPPGETFTNVYFTYGGSTKRDDDDATGGFGLGSKSPFAYTDTFTVTNHHNGEKHMHIMHRVHDDNNGGPGHTPIIEGVTTTERGLMVSVPFKSTHDKVRAWKYLKEILYMSGIKATIHWDGENDDEPIPPTELVVADSLKPTEFITRDEEGHAHGKLFAVYGGVSYEIPHRDEYANDFNFLRNISQELGDIYIGFAPNTLTPLPTREGLNMSERSIESITTALETIQEHFMSLIIPATKTIMLETLTQTSTIGIQPQFVRTKWNKVGTDFALKDMVPNENALTKAFERRNPNQMEASWDSICRLAFQKTKVITRMLGQTKLNTLKSLIWCKVYPDYLQWRHSLLQPKKGNPELYLIATDGFQKSWSKDFIKLWKDLASLTNQDLEPRAKSGHYNSKWEPILNIRAAGGYNQRMNTRKMNIIKRLDKENRLKTPTKPYIDSFWWKKDGSPFSFMMMTKTVIVAKTLTALNKTDFEHAIQATMVPYADFNRYSDYHGMNWETWNQDRSSHCPIPAFVIHQKKDGYKNAIKWLKQQGYLVLEADEPEPRKKPVPVPKNTINLIGPVPEEEAPKPKGYPKVAMHNYETWASEDEYIQKPSTYLYVTKSQISSYSDYPNKDLVKYMQMYCPNMVLVNNKRIADKLDKQGVLSMWERLDKVVDKLLSDKERFDKMYFHYFLQRESEFPDILLELPQMQKLMGVPYVRTKEKENFFRDLKFLRFISDNNRYREGRDVPGDLKQKVKEALRDARREESLVLVRKMSRASKLFSEGHLQYYLKDMKPGERKCFVEKLARFLRTV